MCSRKNGQWYYFKDETVTKAAELVKFLMDKYDIPLENVIRHYDVTHKICPEPFVRVTEDWGKFKGRLKGEDEVMEKRYQTIGELPEWAKGTIQKLVSEGKIADENKLNLSMDMLRTIVILSR